MKKLDTKSKDQLNHTLNESLKGLVEIVSDATKFTKKELPHVAKEIVKFEGVISSLVYMTFLGLILIGCAMSSLGVYHHMYGEDGKVKDLAFFFIPISVVTAISSILLIDLTNSFLKAIYAPRLFILEYVTNLTKRD